MCVCMNVVVYIGSTCENATTTNQKILVPYVHTYTYIYMYAELIHMSPLLRSTRKNIHTYIRAPRDHERQSGCVQNDILFNILHTQSDLSFSQSKRCILSSLQHQSKVRRNEKQKQK